jgi:hypothetical protein
LSATKSANWRELAEQAAREIGKCDEALASARSVRL